MTRAYLRFDPAFFERKALEQGYPAGAVVALVGVFCQGEHQPHRGRFRNERVLRALLGPYAKWVPYLFEHGDVVFVVGSGELYPPGWDEWQEGDWKVGERVKRIRGRRRDVTVPTVTSVTPTTVTDETVHTESTVTVGTESKNRRRPYTRRPAESPTRTLGKRGIAGRGGISSREDSSSRANGAAKSERADVQALLDRGWKQVTPAQLGILDEVLELHNKTGPAWAAAIIRTTPIDADPLAAVKTAHSDWQAEQRERTMRDELEWEATKRKERAESERALDRLRGSLG